MLTSRHHDGVALWDTAYGDLNVVPPRRPRPGRRYVDALREKDLRSASTTRTPTGTTPTTPPPATRAGRRSRRDNRYAEVAPRSEDLAAWERFLAYRDGQVRELASPLPPRPALVRRRVGAQRGAVADPGARRADPLGGAGRRLNARMLSEGDYATPEQGVPIEPPDGPWELCLTINDSWGYQHHDHNHKSIGQLIRYFAETIGAGGNLLLDVGPKEDGTIPAEQVERLEGWATGSRRHAEAVYGTVRGPARRAPLRPEHPLRRPPHPLSDRLRHPARPRSACAACAPRSAGSPVLGTGTELAPPGHRRPPRGAGRAVDRPARGGRPGRRTRPCSPWNSTASWSCTGVPGAAERRTAQGRTWISAWVPLVRQCCSRASSAASVSASRPVMTSDFRVRSAATGPGKYAVRSAKGVVGDHSRSPTRRR